MFKMIGGGVVFGFALYGLVKYLDRAKFDLAPRTDDQVATKQRESCEDASAQA
ncbi:hypothetical protein MNQ95_07495 [Pseudoxanthomonas daejeonensis]|uniref:hypothetical protein n=1 Tax=Pseudoxanthomonas daejeonensis TaxID=266062 RepID=UPI001F5469CB|nr:hypothetical protein [Pseudoxanthomonas daejeonensis]UNK58906.1 hypothetical protein MNQ95_07495 [Pseudoxanthomonas daejeonensis]